MICVSFYHPHFHSYVFILPYLDAAVFFDFLRAILKFFYVAYSLCSLLSILTTDITLKVVRNIPSTLMHILETYSLHFLSTYVLQYQI